MKIAERVIRGDILSLSRLIKKIENEDDDVPGIMKHLHPNTGRACRIGVTGPAGVGKSSLVDTLITHIRKKNFTIGVIAVDPSSPFSGGAVLGDRIRMKQHFEDEAVYIRSMASRGGTGGLPRTVSAAISALDAFGKDVILIETVGVGQTEIEITKKADTVVVVLSPECGDEIQAIKAGILEIADIFAINKADRPGAQDILLSITSVLRLHGRRPWQVPVIKTEAVHDVGIEDLYQEIQAHTKFLRETGELATRRQKQLRDEFVVRVEQEFVQSLLAAIEHDSQLTNHVSRIEKGEIDPYSAADETIKLLKKAYLKSVYPE